MNQYRKGPPFWAVAGLILLAAGFVFILFYAGNPYLYSTTPLGAEKHQAKLSPPGPFIFSSDKVKANQTDFDLRGLSHFNFNRSGVEPTGLTRDRKWVESSRVQVRLPEGVPGEPRWVKTSEFLLAYTDGGWFVTLDEFGQLIWKLKIQLSEDDEVFEPLVEKSRTYISTKLGRILAIDSSTGQMIWESQFAKEVFAAPILAKNNLLIVATPSEPLRKALLPPPKKKKKKTPSLEKNIFSLISINPNSGQAQKLLDGLNLKTPMKSTVNSSGQTLFLGGPDRVTAVNLEKWKLAWHQLLPEDVLSPVVSIGSRVLVASFSGQLYVLDNKSKGAMDWEFNLESPLLSVPVYLPKYDRVAISTKEGFSVLDLNKQERAYKYSIPNKNPLKQGWSSRLNGKMIQLTGMKWVYAGWTYWSPCGLKKICIHNPETGQILERLVLSVPPDSQPFFRERNIYFLSKGKKNFELIELMEEDDHRRMLRERASNAKAESSSAGG